MLILRNLLLFVVPLGAAVALFVMARQSSEAPMQHDDAAVAVSVRVTTLSADPVTPTIVGHGVVAPSVTWRAVSRVAGTVTALDPRLDEGEILPAGTELATIDETDYALALAQAEAAHAAAEAELVEMRMTETNLQGMLALERETLTLQEADTARQRALIESGTTARTTLNASERTLLAQRSRVEDMEGDLRLIPARVERLTAEVARLDADVKAAAANLARTRLILPVEARVASVEVEAGEYVATNATLATLEGVAEAEIVVRLPEGAFARFAALAGGATTSLSAEVSSMAGGVERRWPAKVLRKTGSIAGDSRSVGVVVGVEDPLGRRPGAASPPLYTGSFVDVTLTAPAVHDRVAIPLSALRNGAVYLADEADRLQVIAVEIEARQGDWAVVAPGLLAAGDRVVLDDIVPAVEGMPLAPVESDVAGPALSVAVIRSEAQ
ncbi:MAG: hypothetical protein AAFT19_11355 [Pseudomonadota bacterium]